MVQKGSATMKKTLVGLLMIISGVSMAPVSRADTFSVGVELPLSYTYQTADDGSNLTADGLPIGLLVFVKFPILVGVGAEHYQVKIDQPGEHHIATTMIDVFYQLPLPVVSLSLGLGYGQAEVKGDNAAYYEPTPASKFFLRLGVPLLAWMQITASYHQIASKIKVKNHDYRLETGGTMGAVGLNIGF
jgi:hypothetical protein